MKKLLVFLLLLILSIPLKAQQIFCSELFISEYVEGWGNNKAIEIYNPTNQTIDLSQYMIVRYVNGNNIATSTNAIQLTGIIQPFEVHVGVIEKLDPFGTGQDVPVDIALQNVADAFYCPDYVINNTFAFNGDDALILAKGNLATLSPGADVITTVGFQIIDIFGKVGEQPANGAWSTVFPHNTGLGELVTKDHSLIRKSSVLNGVTNLLIPSFNPLNEYDSLPPYIVINGNSVGNWGTLGSHNCICNSISTNISSTIQSCTSTYALNGIQYLVPGTYYQISQDTLFEITLTHSPIITNISVSTCDIPYIWNGQQYTQSGQYTQILTNQFGCDSVVTLTLNVNTNDNISISPNPAFGNSPLNVAFANQTPNMTNYNFTWYFGDGTSQQSNAPFLSHIYTQNGYADVTIVADNLTTGCSSSQTFNDMIFVIGGVTCTHTAALNQTGPLSGCSGDSILLSCNTDASFSYQWNRNGVPVSGATSNSFYPTQSGSYTVTIYQNNCPVTSAGISVTINPLPSVPTITSSGTITPCSGGSMTLTAPSGFTSYLWNTGSTASSLVVSQSGNYSVSVTNSNGCSQTSNPFSVNASFMAAPQVCIVGVDSLTNENRLVWEKPLTLGIDSFYVYKETNVSNVYTKIGATDYNDLAVFLDVNSNPAVQAYRYKISALDTCGVETNVGDFHKTIHLTINQGIGGAWNLIWSHYEGLNFGSYNIYRGTDPSNISLLTTIQSNLNSYSDLTPPTGPLYYQIEVVNPNNCDPTKSLNYGVSRSNIVNNGQIGVNENKVFQFNVYPNPTNGVITLQSAPELMGNSFTILDFMGRILMKDTISNIKQDIDMINFAKGTYYLKIEGALLNIEKLIKN